MAIWLNHVAIAAPRNGTADHTVDPSTGTVVAGTLFTPTAGRLLVAVMEGAVTSTTPSGWTLPTNGSAVNNTGLYVWYRTATGADTIVTGHNGSNYPVVCDIYEFESGSSFVGAASNPSVSTTAGVGPTLSGLTGTNWVAYALGASYGDGSGSATTSWSVGVEAVDTTGLALTGDGYTYSLAYSEDFTGSSSTSTATNTTPSTATAERLTFAVKVTAEPTEIALREAGSATLAAALVTAINPVVPASATTGDLSVLTVAMKPYNATITTPTGWTKIGEATNGTVANAADVGSTKVAVFVRESATPGAIGNLTLAGSPNTVGAVIHTYSKPPGWAWDYSQFTTGGDTVNDANFSATGAAGIAVATGDWVIGSTAVNSDLGTVTVPTIGGMSGATLDTVGVRTPGTTAVGGGAITTGNDCRVIVVDRKVTAGSSAAAPTFTYTNASITSGTSLWLRLRASALPIVATWAHTRTAIRRAANW